MVYKYFSFLILFFIASVPLSAQQDGYWDKDRATSKQIIVGAGDRIIVSTEDLPVGTTEVVYRITLLDENQQLASSLVSVLKSIPDPTGISQGSAGAILLMSKISGEDKCKYAIFSNQSSALEYENDGKTSNSCFMQNNPVNKDAKRLSVNSSSCLKSNVLWFGFESKNWIMNQRIVLEVVPWVDVKLSRGWSLENRKLIIGQCKATDLAKKLPNSDDYCVCLLDKIQKEYKFQEYQKLMAMEISKTFRDFGKSCWNEIDGRNAVDNSIRNQITALLKAKKYRETIEKSLQIINNGKATALDYNTIGICYIFTKQYDKAIKFLKEGEHLDDSELLVKLNLAHAYLLNDNYSSSKSIYKKYQTQNVTDSLSWTQKTKLDFEAFQNAGLQSDDFDKIIKLLDNN